jgi:phosphate transport system permease protein
MVASLTMAFMAIPTMISLSYNAVKAVPDGYRFASLGLGISKEKTTFSIVRKSASTKLISAVILGMSRVIGETMAIMMIAGNATGKLNDSSFGGFIFSSVRTLASTIGLEVLENSGRYHESALYAIGMFLFILVFIINIVILIIANFDKFKTKLQVRNQSKMLAKMHSYETRYADYQLTKMVNLKTTDKIVKKTYSGTFIILM